MKLSSAARPPIQEHEVTGAVTSICRQHGAEHLDGWFTEGRVFFCPLGRMYWRFTKHQGGMYAKLPYHHEGIV